MTTYLVMSHDMTGPSAHEAKVVLATDDRRAAMEAIALRYETGLDFDLVYAAPDGSPWRLASFAVEEVLR